MSQAINPQIESDSEISIAVAADNGAPLAFTIPVRDAARAALVSVTFFVAPLAGNRLGSPFYAAADGGSRALARLTLADRQAMLAVNGDLHLHFEQFDGYYRNSQVAAELLARGMTDDDYGDLVDGGFSADENWFETVPLLPNETELEALPDVDGDLPAALARAVACLLDDEYWQTELAGYRPAPEDIPLVECGNCGEDFPQGYGGKYDSFCSSHCQLRHYGEDCPPPCARCGDDRAGSVPAARPKSGGEAQ